MVEVILVVSGVVSFVILLWVVMRVITPYEHPTKEDLKRNLRSSIKEKSIRRTITAAGKNDRTISGNSQNNSRNIPNIHNATNENSGVNDENHGSFENVKNHDNAESVDVGRALHDPDGRGLEGREEEMALIRDVLRSSAKQSQSMLSSLHKAEAERNQLMEILSESKGASNAAFRSLSDIPSEATESVDDELYANLSKNNKKLKERLYQLERENLYLKESLEGDSEERDNRSEKDGGPKA